jgi:hypothetical protein
VALDGDGGQGIAGQKPPVHGDDRRREPQQHPCPAGEAHFGEGCGDGEETDADGEETDADGAAESLVLCRASGRLQRTPPTTLPRMLGA